jgi:hypothetical protein
MKTKFLFLIIFLMLWQPSISVATAGFAEWALLTPNNHLIAHADPFLAEYGTCLLSKSKKQVFVSHIQWWRYYPTYVVGKAEKGFFLFNESSEQVVYFETEAAFLAKIKQLSLDEPLTERLTPADGWNQVWEPILKSQSAPKTPPITVCIIDDVAKKGSWQRCQDKWITVTGIHTLPHQVMQHPILVMPASIYLSEQKLSFQFQDYMNIGSYQVILLSKKEITCLGEMEVKGKLQQVALGGKKGTKNEYKNWVIEVDKYRCLVNGEL